MSVTRIKNNQITDATITNVKISSATLTGDLMNPNLTFNSNLVLNGNLTVTGNVTAVQSTTTQITDPLLTLGLGNSGTAFDLGLVLIRGSGGNRFIGFKENEGAFVFINTTEDGLTTGNIATTAYSNVIFGNAVTLGSSQFGGITLSGNTISASGALTVRSDTGTVTIPNATILSSTLSVVGATTVASLTSNAGIIATTGSFSSNLTANALTVNNSATIGDTLGVTGNINASSVTLTGSLVAAGSGDFDGGLQSTPIGNAAPSTALFTTVGASSNATVAALTVNGTATLGNTVGITGTLTGAAAQFTTINGSGTATLNAVNVNNAATAGTTLTVGGTATVNALVSNGSIQGTTLNGSGNATVNALTVNTSAVVGSTLQAVAGIQATPIGNVTAASGAFTTLDATGAITGATTITTTGTATLNALNVNNAATAGTTLTVGGTATVNALVSNTTLTAASGTIQGNLLVEGNLAVLGNLTFINVDTFTVEDPIIQLNTGPNGAPLSVDNNFDSGVSTNYYDTADRRTFFGRKDSSGFFEYFSNVDSETGNVVTGTYGTIKSGNLELVSAATVGTTLSVVGNATVAALTVNGSAVVGTTLQAVAGVQATPIGNVTASTGAFTTLNATGAITGATTLTTTGTATLNALAVNNAATIGTTLVTGGTATVNALISNGAIQGTTLSGSGNATVAALTVNGSAVVGTTLQAVAGVQATPIGNVTASTGNFTTVGATGTATVNVLVSNGAVSGTSAQFTTVNGSGNATVAAITVNGSAVVGTTLQAVAGIQATAIGNVTASSGAFTTLTSSGLTTFTDATDSTDPTNGAVVITGGLAVGKDLNVTTAANIGNVTINNVTISSKTANIGLNINPNGTGVTTINSGLNTSRTVINGTAANTLVVSGTQVGVNTSSFIGGATFQVNALDSILLPAGSTGDRPGSPVAGMLRFSTSQGTIEFYTGNQWEQPVGDFTVVVANSQTGNGSATTFTIPVANASTAGTMVSINGVVQEPITAYAISGNTVTFTEAPAVSDTIDFRVFTTTAQVVEVTDIAGTTGLFMDLPAANSKITTIKTFGTESFSIQANSTARFTGNAEPSANVTFNLGSTTNRWKDLFLSGSTIHLGNIQIKNTTGNTVSFVTSTGAPADLSVDINDPSGIQATPIGNATASTGNFTTVDATGNISASFFTGNGSLLTGIDATSIQNGTSNVKVFLNGSVSTGVGGSNVFVVSSTGVTVTGTLGATGTFTGTTVQAATIGNSGATLTGTLSTAAQTNITSVGTLTGLTLSGTLNGTTVQAATIGNSGATLTGTLQTAAQTNITSVGTLTGLTLSGTLNGTTVQAATIGNSGATLTGTLSTAAQTNITSVGTLASLTVSGALSSGAHTITGSPVTAIINGGTTGTGNIGATGATFNTVFAKATTAQYADLAENYSGDAVYEPGTVVHFGGSQEVTLCDEDMCRRVAGVVSTNPAYLMNSHLQGIATAVALQGRVPCKVRGTVRLGDMMVSAGNGFARAEANPVLGSVIGKALANFDGIEGVIEVVVGRV